jgi:cell division septum initiation protein DivIVA
MDMPDPPYEGPPADITDLVEQLQELADESRRMPFSHSLMVDEARFLELVDLLRRTVPGEIRQAQRVVRERERIIGEAQTEAARILSAARSRGEYWASEDAILNEVRQRSEQLLRHAAEERRRGIGEVEVFALQRLSDFEGAIRQGFEIIHTAMRDAVSRLDEVIEEAGGARARPADVDDEYDDYEDERDDRHG